MTIKKLSLSIVASAMLATSSFAAIVNPTGVVVPTISSELLSVQAVPVVMTAPVVFTCKMTETNVATGNQAGVQLTIPGLDSAAMVTAAAATDVYEYDVTTGLVTSAAVAKFGSTVAGRNMVVYDGAVGTAITEEVTYVIADTGLAINAVPTLAAGALVYNAPQNSGSVIATVEVVSNDGVSVLDIGQGSVGTATKQYSMAVTIPADELIDATNGFFIFRGAPLTDDIAFNFVDNSTPAGIAISGMTAVIDYPAVTGPASAMIVYDQNLTDYKMAEVAAAAAAGPIASTGLNDFNTSYNMGLIALSDTYTVTYTKVSAIADAMDTTNFTLSGDVLFTGTTTPYVLLDGADAGAWNIFGYNAQIPNVRNNTSNLSTYINITNSSAIAADAIFTILPETDGTNAGESICRSNEGAIPANASRKFNVASILANSNCSDAVKAGVNMAIEIAVPTTPNAVYANAYTKNLDLPDFIVLPVYNSSAMGY